MWHLLNQRESAEPATYGVNGVTSQPATAQPASSLLNMNFSQNMASGMSYLRRRFSSSDLSKELTERQVMILLQVIFVCSLNCLLLCCCKGLGWSADFDSDFGIHLQSLPNRYSVDAA